MNSWARYSTMGIELIVTVSIFVCGGLWLDKKRAATFPLMTLLLSILGIVIALVRFIKNATQCK